ncbi:UNVERIFIED_CONTAM: Dol-P-Man:Man(7)GlcNAc(2)-PP-Dol alpha-1,6-mannosyltransferase, partial [Sesamum radiatum]
NLAYGYWFKGSFYAALKYLIFATIVFRCDILLLVSPLGLELLLVCDLNYYFCICYVSRYHCDNEINYYIHELQTHSFHWYFTSALPRSLLAAYPLFLLGVLLDRRIRFCVIPVLSFVLLYSKLPHKELRFIISSLPIFNLSAAIASSRIYNNRKKSFWKYLYVAMLGLFLISLGCTVLTFMASYENYPSGHALKALHKMGRLTNNSKEVWVHIDTFSAMNGISRFCENNELWRYSKEEGILLHEFQGRNFTYLLSEHALIHGYKCLFSTKGFSGVRLHVGFPPISLVKRPKVYVHANAANEEVIRRTWPGC